MKTGNFAGAAEGDAFLLKQGDRNFPQPVALVESVGLGEAIGKVEGNLHDDSLALWIYFKVWVGGSECQSDRHEWYRLD